MKLRYSPTSPYTRKAVVTARETGLFDRIEIVPTNVWVADTDIGDDNPLGKIPALLLDGGEVLYDSRVVCEYLDSLHDGQPLFPPHGGARWTALRRQALGDGMMDACVNRFLELKRDADKRNPDWIARQERAIFRALDALDDEADSLGEAVTIGHIALGCALGYLDLRYAESEWRSGRPALADWYDGFSGRRSMMETEPPKG